jgi:hypothetical protein
MIHTLQLDPVDLERVARFMAKHKEETKIRKDLTLESYIQEWAAFVGEIEKGYDLTIFDYTNDLAIRDILQRVLQLLSEPGRGMVEEVLEPLDRRFLTATTEIKRPLRGEDRSFWRVRIPKLLVGELREDLESEGLIP